MLWIIGAVLFALWVIGLLLKVTTGLIHIALIAAIVFFAWGFLRGRHSATSA